MFKPLAFVIGILNAASVLFAQNPTYELVIYSRSNSGIFVNNIQVTCRFLNGTIDSQATYWLNVTTVIPREYQWTGDFGSSGITIPLTREYEGNYTCGQVNGDTTTRSDPKTLIVLPTRIANLEDNITTTFYSHVGSAVTLSCPITPGKLLDHYSCDWKKNGTRIATFPPTSSSSRYSISAEDFSLTIFNVNGEDNSLQYTCVVKVRYENQDHTYRQTENLFLALIVDAPPIITSGPEPQTVAISANGAPQGNATFTCTAIGLPAPSITWTHNDNDVPSGSSNKYATVVSEQVRADDDGRFKTTSILTVKMFESRGTDSGSIHCNAQSLGISERASTTIAVLGNPTFQDVQITRDHDVLIILRFASVIHATMQLNVTYLDLDTMTISPESVRAEEYANTNTIYYLDKESSIPKRFRVMINVVTSISTEPVIGPLIDFNRKEYNREQQTQCTIRDIVTTASLGTFVGIFAIIVIICPIMVCILVSKCLKAQEERNRVKFAREKAMELCENIKDNPAEWIEKYKTYRQNLYRIEMEQGRSNCRKQRKPQKDGDEGQELQGGGNEEPDAFEELLDKVIPTTKKKRV